MRSKMKKVVPNIQTAVAYLIIIFFLATAVSTVITNPIPPEIKLAGIFLLVNALVWLGCWLVGLFKKEPAVPPSLCEARIAKTPRQG
jgi:protein-S-isoprenylcysteine O-methyltransferase Ste14